MRLRSSLYLALLAAVGAGRLIELGVSRRRQRALATRGVPLVRERYFSGIVAVHTAVLAGSALEVAVLERRVIPALAIVSGIAFVLANGLRWWVIATLGEHWNVHVMDSAGLGVVTTGPFRWLRHPNYLALIVELEALPLIRTAWLTALIGGIAHAFVLRRRVATEEAVLMRHPEYRSAMASKPRFLPRLARS